MKTAEEKLEKVESFCKKYINKYKKFDEDAVDILLAEEILEIINGADKDE